MKKKREGDLNYLIDYYGDQRDRQIKKLERKKKMQKVYKK